MKRIWPFWCDKDTPVLAVVFIYAMSVVILTITIPLQLLMLPVFMMGNLYTEGQRQNISRSVKR